MAATSSGTPRVRLELVEKMENLEAQVKLLSEKQNITAAPMPMTYQSPFTMEIRTAALPETFAMPQIPQYSGTTDPSEHAELYRDQMLIKGVDESAMCRMFTHTLTGPAKSWFRSLKAGSISSLHQLLSEFTKEFSYASTKDRVASKLAFIKQREADPLAEYVSRFHQEVLRTGAFGNQYTLTHFEKNLRLGKLWRSFQKKRPLSYGEARSRALQQVEMDEKCQLKRQEDKADVTKNKEKPKRVEAPIPRVPRARSPPRAALRGRGYNPQGASRVPQPPRSPPPDQREPPPRPRYESYHPLNRSPEQIFYHIRDSGLLRPPKPMKKYPNMKRSLKYCEFHEDFGHSTAECFTLREEIESLILSGYLKEFVAGMREARKSAEHDKGKRVADGSPEREVPPGHKKGVYVRMIMGGPTLAGQSRRAIKGYGRSLSITTNMGREVNLNEWGTPKVPHHPPPILFTEKDAEGISYPHDDAFVITLKVATGKVARTLVDTGSSVDIIFKSALDQLLIESPKITPYATPLIGFAGDMVIPKGIITLPVTLGKVPHRVVHMIDFLIVDHPGAYNIILGRPFLVATKAVVSMHYLTMKVPAAQEVITIKGDQQSARGCYSVASKVTYQIASDPPMKGYPSGSQPTPSPSKRALARQRRTVLKKSPQVAHPREKLEFSPRGMEAVTGDSSRVPDGDQEEPKCEVEAPLDPRILKDEMRGTPVEDLISVSICATDPTKTVKVGSNLSEEQREKLITFLCEHLDVFAWFHSDIPGIPHSLSCHKLNVSPHNKPVKQKRRAFNQERYDAIEQEVDRLLAARFIREAVHPDWVSNVVLVKKSNGKWRMCVDFTDLNKSCPKDSFPLPRVDQLVDATAGHEMLSFMDAFSGYN
ncbi:uncharacterized protein LOC127903121 [Citrus sinensis]|uniref:uncharacterized protein LOC127903121 n=1 Tax=Citrus sinensis TaxID=2711 RepID=UPI00227854D0|nr:uncharacterized protein LOC127903121 [Citrus sinensis]